MIVIALLYTHLASKIIYLKFVRKYRYLSIANIGDKIGLIALLVVFVANVICAFNGNSSNIAGALMMCSLIYPCVRRILCFEDNETIFIEGTKLLKSKTYITNKEQRNKSNVVMLKSGRVVVNILVSSKGKQALYNRIGDNTVHNEKNMQ